MTRVALVTNVRQFGGPGSAAALAGQGLHVAVHDATFTDDAIRRAYEVAHLGHSAHAEQDPDELVAAVLARHGRLDVLVANDIAPFASSFADADATQYRDLLEALVVTPFRLAKAAVGPMLERRSGCLIFVTSATAKRPIAGTALYAAARAATVALAGALPRELWGSAIQVNAIGPHWMANPTYFPPGWDDDPVRRERFEQEVPMQRLGTQEELGALVAMLASGTVAPLTGQFLGFSCGWLP